jgi:hypothetical protein
LESTWSGWLQLFGRLMLEWSVGSIVVGGALALATFVLAHAVLRHLAAAPTNSHAAPAD